MRARDNPFSAHRIERITFRPLGPSFDQLMDELTRMQYRAAIIGTHGSGKTTLLAQIRQHLSRGGFTVKSIFTSLDQPLIRQDRGEFLAELKPGEIVLLDGADHLSLLAWQRFKRSVLRSAGGLIITSHKASLMPTLLECSTTERLLAELVEELLDGPHRIGQVDLLGIYTEHDGNIRDCLRHLYDFGLSGAKETQLFSEK